MIFLRVQMIANTAGEFKDDFHRTYTQTWQVVVDDPTACEAEIFFAPGLPLPRAVYKVYGVVKDAYAFCTSVRAQRTDRDDPYLWEVTCEFGTKTRDPQRESQNKDDSPVAKPPKRHWGKMVVKKPLDPDKSDPPKPAVNAAGQPYVPAPEYEVRLQTLTIVRNEAGFDQALADATMDTVNAVQFYGEGNDGQVRCTDFSGVEDYEKGVRFWIVTYEFLFDGDGHKISLRNHGTLITHDALGNTIAPTMIVDPYGVGTTGPVDLDAVGGRLAAGASPIYNKFVGYPPRDWTSLHLEY